MLERKGWVAVAAGSGRHGHGIHVCSIFLSILCLCIHPVHLQAARCHAAVACPEEEAAYAACLQAAGGGGEAAR